MSEKSIFDCENKKQLAALIGIQPPESFCGFVNAVRELFAGNLSDAGGFTDATMFFRPYPECRYAETPFELIPFGDLGVDGAHFGFVVHAPELKAAEYPIGIFNPLDFIYGVNLVGENTHDFMERKIASVQKRWQKKGNDAALFAESKQRFEQKLNQLVKHLNLKPDRRRALDGDGWISGGVAPIRIPAGWQHQKGSDGIGVLAPKRFFNSKLDGDSPETAVECLKQGYPASALHLLREAVFKDGDNGSEIFKMMAKAYDALDREVFARMARNRAKAN